MHHCMCAYAYLRACLFACVQVGMTAKDYAVMEGEHQVAARL